MTANIKAVDPVTLGLCSQLELDLAVSRAAVKRERAIKRAAKAGATLKPVQDAPAAAGTGPQPEAPSEAPVIIEDSSDKPEDETSEP